MVGPFADGVVLCQDVLVGNGPREFQVTIRHLSFRIGERHHLPLDVLGKGSSPQHRLDTPLCGYKVNPAHAGSGRVARTHRVRELVGYDFGDACGPTPQAVG